MSNEILTVLTICVPIITALISGIVSYILSVKNSNKEIEKVRELHKNELENMKENHQLEMEKIEMQQKHEKDMKNQEVINQLGAKLVGQIITNESLQNLITNTINTEIDKQKEKNKNGN